jgi:cytoskeleton protein RodZ
MNSIGEKLRQERLRQGLDLEQIAELTKITPQMLEAIEADDFDKLPGSFFARSFVRQYARALGLDEEEFESELRRVAGFGHPAAEQAEQAPMPEVVARPQPVPAARYSPSRQSLGSLVAFLLILVACSAIYTLWQKTRATSAKSPQVSAVQTPSPTPVPAATPTPSPEAATPTPTPLETPAAESTATPQPEASQPPSAEPSRPAPPAPVAEARGIHLELRATSEAWVRVVSDGKTVYTGVLQPNEARVFEGTKSVTLRTGNAAALAATYNGKPLGELGPEGEVRTIQFTSSGFQVVTPAPAPPNPPAVQP